MGPNALLLPEIWGGGWISVLPGEIEQCGIIGTLPSDGAYSVRASVAIAFRHGFDENRNRIKTAQELLNSLDDESRKALMDAVRAKIGEMAALGRGAELLEARAAIPDAEAVFADESRRILWLCEAAEAIGKRPSKIVLPDVGRAGLGCLEDYYRKDRRAFKSDKAKSIGL